jgi:peroxin-19
VQEGAEDEMKLMMEKLMQMQAQFESSGGQDMDTQMDPEKAAQMASELTSILTGNMDPQQLAAFNNSAAVPATPKTKKAPVAAKNTADSKAASIDDAVRMLGEGVKDINDGNGPNMEGMPQEAIMKMLEGFAGDGDGAGMLEEMMSGLMSKEYMYQPMQDLEGKMKQYLTEHKSTLNDDEKARYTGMHDCLLEILAVYDSAEADSNNSQVMDLLQKMQTYGDPPQELIGDFEMANGDPMGGGGGLPGMPGMGDEDAEAMMKQMTEGCAQQ